MRFVIFCLLLISTLFAATTTIPKYNRDDYGKTWGIVNPKTHIDTRDSILIRDNTAPVGKYIINTKTHKIDIGSWVCPYCGKVFIDPLKLDIDHVVPLGEAHISGAYLWTSTKKNQYFNYVGNKVNLRAVCSSCNREKGDKDPANWMPQINKIQYLQNWVYIKKAWNLKMDKPESTFVFKSLKDGTIVTVPVVKK